MPSAAGRRLRERFVSGALAGAGGGTGGRQAVSPDRTGVPVRRHVPQFRCSDGGASGSAPFSTSPAAGGCPGNRGAGRKAAMPPAGRASPFNRPPDWYAPTVADVGHRLRASAYYADRLGNRVKAITRPSEPVQPDFLKAVLAPPGSEAGKGAASAFEAYRIITSKYAVYLYGNRLFYANRSCIWEDEYGTRFPVDRLFAGFRKWNARTRYAGFRVAREFLEGQRNLRHRAPASRQRHRRHPNRTG